MRDDIGWRGWEKDGRERVRGERSVHAWRLGHSFDVGPLLQEQPHDLDMPSLGRKHQACGAVLRRPIYIYGYLAMLCIITRNFTRRVQPS